MKKSILYTIPLCLLIAGSAMAAGNVAGHSDNSFNRHTGFYASANVGTNIAYILLGPNSDTYGGFSWSANAGYSFTPYIGLEVGFIQGYVPDLPKANIPYLTARFNIPIGQRFSLIAKFGIEDIYAKQFHHGDVGAFMGLGASYAITRHIAVDVTCQGAEEYIVGIGSMSGGVTYNF